MCVRVCVRVRFLHPVFRAKVCGQRVVLLEWFGSWTAAIIQLLLFNTLYRNVYRWSLWTRRGPVFMRTIAGLHLYLCHCCLNLVRFSMFFKVEAVQPHVYMGQLVPLLFSLHSNGLSCLDHGAIYSFWYSFCSFNDNWSHLSIVIFVQCKCIKVGKNFNFLQKQTRDLLHLSGTCTCASIHTGANKCCIFLLNIFINTVWHTLILYRFIYLFHLQTR